MLLPVCLYFPFPIDFLNDTKTNIKRGPTPSEFNKILKMFV